MIPVHVPAAPSHKISVCDNLPSMFLGDLNYVNSPTIDPKTSACFTTLNSPPLHIINNNDKINRSKAINEMATLEDKINARGGDSKDRSPGVFRSCNNSIKCEVGEADRGTNSMIAESLGASADNNGAAEVLLSFLSIGDALHVSSEMDSFSGVPEKPPQTGLPDRPHVESASDIERRQAEARLAALFPNGHGPPVEISGLALPSRKRPRRNGARNDVPTGFFTSTRVRAAVKCRSCSKPRCLYSQLKPRPTSLQRLQRNLGENFLPSQLPQPSSTIFVASKPRAASDDSDDAQMVVADGFICGGPVLAPEHELASKLIVNDALGCNDHVEYAYYSARLPLPPVCCHCGLALSPAGGNIDGGRGGGEVAILPSDVPKGEDDGSVRSGSSSAGQRAPLSTRFMCDTGGSVQVDATVLPRCAGCVMARRPIISRRVSMQRKQLRKRRGWMPTPLCPATAARPPPAAAGNGVVPIRAGAVEPGVGAGVVAEQAGVMNNRTLQIRNNLLARVMSTMTAEKTQTPPAAAVGRVMEGESVGVGVGARSGAGGSPSDPSSLYSPPLVAQTPGVLRPGMCGTGATSGDGNSGAVSAVPFVPLTQIQAVSSQSGVLVTGATPALSLVAPALQSPPTSSPSPTSSESTTRSVVVGDASEAASTALELSVAPRIGVAGSESRSDDHTRPSQGHNPDAVRHLQSMIVQRQIRMMRGQAHLQQVSMRQRMAAELQRHQQRMRHRMLRQQLQKQQPIPQLQSQQQQAQKRVLEPVTVAVEAGEGGEQVEEEEQKRKKMKVVVEAQLTSPPQRQAKPAVTASVAVAAGASPVFDLKSVSAEAQQELLFRQQLMHCQALLRVQAYQRALRDGTSLEAPQTGCGVSKEPEGEEEEGDEAPEGQSEGSESTDGGCEGSFVHARDAMEEEEEGQDALTQLRRGTLKFDTTTNLVVHLRGVLGLLDDCGDNYM